MPTRGVSQNAGATGGRGIPAVGLRRRKTRTTDEVRATREGRQRQIDGLACKARPKALASWPLWVSK
jgi:hypothetical protein